MNFRMILIEARKNLNFTQREMAKRLNVSDKTISKWETGVNFPDLKMLNQIAKVIGISVAELLEADDLKVPESTANNDSLLVNKFRTQQIIAYILFLSSLIIIVLGLRISYLMLIIGILLLASSVILFSLSLISFRSSYENRRNAQSLDRISNFYSLMYFESIALVLFYVFMTFYTARGFAQILLIFFQVLPIILRKWILKYNNYEIKKDKINIVLTRTFWSIVIVGNLIYGLLLTGWFPFDNNLITVVLIPTFTSMAMFSPLILSIVISFRKSYVAN